jgi:hypothetical protein
MTSRTRLRLALALIFVLGMVLVVTPWREVHNTDGETLLAEWMLRLIEGLGEALAIAALLGWFVDEAAKRQLLEDVLDDISAHIVGRLLEPRLREQIEQHLKADLVRAKWDITYIISDWPGQPADSMFKKLTTRFDYEMVNRSASERTYLVVYDVEKSLFPEIGEAKILKVEGRTLVGGLDEFTFPFYPGDERGLDKAGSNWIFKRPVLIFPSPAVEYDTKDRRRRAQLVEDKQPSYAIHTESEELVTEGSILPFFAKHPVLKTTLTIEYPIDRLNVLVELSLGPDKTDEGKPLENGKGKRWEFPDPMLPGQGFTVRFRRIPTAAAETAPAPATIREVQA